MTSQILHGDCIEMMRTLPDASIDAVVTDPPYELGFMGKSWDSTGIAYRVDVWAECLRVLKPGGHLLAFSGARTYHRMTCAIEDAGFTIRDQIAWIFGSGFPKSLDVSKAIDKQRCEDIAPIRAICRTVRASMDVRGLNSGSMTQHFGGCNSRLIDHWSARDSDSQPTLPTSEQWETLCGLFPELAYLNDEFSRLNNRKGSPGDVYADAPVIGEHEGKAPGFAGERFVVVDKTMRERSEKGAQWIGWGTALKPAHEPICVARKPLIGTVAANVQAFGTGALNIDASRVGVDGGCAGAGAGARVYGNGLNGTFAAPVPGLGRWPANVIHDSSDEVLAVFPAAPGQQSDTGPQFERNANIFGKIAGVISHTARGDAGSAARFFYCAKASAADRNDGCEAMEKIARGSLNMRSDDHAERNGNLPEARANHHPTVKPTDLMRYLVTLVTPPGGVVLDPFMGSGSTGRGCALAGFDFIGCELDADYLEIARARIKSAELEAERIEAAASDATRQSALFS